MQSVYYRSKCFAHLFAYGELRAYRQIVSYPCGCDTINAGRRFLITLMKYTFFHQPAQCVSLYYTEAFEWSWV